jgi:hypothetical protein
MSRETVSLDGVLDVQYKAGRVGGASQKATHVPGGERGSDAS